jgi:small subunit ribosomal protein S6
MTRRYETVCIINPDAGEGALKEMVQKAAAFLEKNAGNVKVEQWGRRKMAYSIKKKREGFYILFHHASSAQTKDEFERMLKFNEDVLRFQTVKAEKKGSEGKNE